jgi:hypothetical protein
MSWKFPGSVPSEQHVSLSTAPNVNASDIPCFKHSCTVAQWAQVAQPNNPHFQKRQVNQTAASYVYQAEKSIQPEARQRVKKGDTKKKKKKKKTMPTSQNS